MWASVIYKLPDFEFHSFLLQRSLPTAHIHGAHFSMELTFPWGFKAYLLFLSILAAGGLWLGRGHNLVTMLPCYHVGTDPRPRITDWGDPGSLASKSPDGWTVKSRRLDGSPSEKTELMQAGSCFQDSSAKTWAIISGMDRSCTNKPLTTSRGWRNDLEWKEEETAVPPT